MLSFRVTGVVALSALLVFAGGSALAAPASFGSGATEGGTTISGTVTGVTFTQVSVGEGHSLAVGSDGNVYAWGSNYYGQLGDGSTTDRTTPVLVSVGDVPSGVTLIRVAAGNRHSLALGSDGNAYAWGSNRYGQLADGSTTDRTTPVLVSAGAVPSGVTLTQVAAGGLHSLAVGSDGNVYAWGYNSSGQLGDGSTTDRTTPVLVSGGAMPSAVTPTQVAAGWSHSLAVGADDKVYAWGDNSSGGLGDGSATDRTTPVLVSVGDVPSGVTLTQVAAGAYYSLAVGSDGNAYAWGYNSSGQLGDGSTTDRTTPVLVSVGDVPSAVTLTQVAAGTAHSLAVGSNGNAYAWGDNNSGGLGDGSTTDSPVPLRVSVGAVPSGVTLIQALAGSLDSMALGSDGRMYGWGDNGYGQLGDGSTVQRVTPVATSMSPVISGASFDSVDGTGLTQSAGAWSIDSPAHAAGAVDVVVSYTQFGVASTQTFVGGFTYLALLPATGSPFPFLAVGSALLLLIVGSGFLVVRRTAAQRLTT